jgi:dTDP-4-dehydrorhamnose 3,5-epimerase-like enzyme
LIKFPSFETKGGLLSMLQSGKKINEVPFPIKRVLVTKCGAGSEKRGGHTHHKSRQIFTVLSGGCTVELDDGKNKKDIVLSPDDEGLIMEPYVWHTMKDFKENTITIALFNSIYDEKDYIRNYEEFKKYAK